MIELINGEALEEMDKLIEQGVVVDAIIADVPYQTTACAWDSVIPFNNYIMLPKSSRSKKLQPVYKDDYILQELKKGREYNEIVEYFNNHSKEGMWQKLNKLIKPNGAIVLFGSEPFSSYLRMSNIKNYKYDWKWEKEKAGNFQLAKKMPMKKQEDICVFYKKFNIYNAQGLVEINKTRKNNKTKNGTMGHLQSVGKRSEYVQKFTNYPTEVLKFNNQKGLHESQKPVGLIEYLIKTYTNEGELVLDFTMGSFTTAIACLNTKRRFIGIELDEHYFKVGSERLEKHLETLDYKPKITYKLK